MSFMEKVAEAPNQREATLLIAGALDVILEAISDLALAAADSWAPATDVWGAEGWAADAPPETDWTGTGYEAEPAAMHREGLDYVIPPAPPEVKADRRQWVANYINDPAIEGAYEKGGPEWLTAYDTDFVMTLPADARQLMAVDFEKRGLTQEAREFAVAFLRGDATTMDTAAPLADTLH